LGDVAGDEAKQSLGQRGRHLARPGRRIIDEIIDREIRVGTDGENRLIEQHELHARFRGAADFVAEVDFLTARRPVELLVEHRQEIDVTLNRRRDTGLLRRRNRIKGKRQ
jgi:hypothetical protein